MVMGIINVNHDSFYASSRRNSKKEILDQASKMIAEGASVLDLGGVSTRPGAADLDPETEINRVIPAIECISGLYPDILISVDTFHTKVAIRAIKAGAAIINDITSGERDPEMIYLAKEYNCPYIMMHMQGTPQTMQNNPEYKDVLLEVLDYFIQKASHAKSIGLTDIIIDPGFGFGKTISHNYQLLNGLRALTILEKPILAGLSRKGMLWKPLNSTPEEVLPATIAANHVALQNGAGILRVHDVAATMQLIRTFELINTHKHVSSVTKASLINNLASGK